MKNKANEKDDTINELRHLLLGSEIEKIEELKQKLENPQIFSSEISNVLPQAIKKSAELGTELSEAMVPTVEEIVRLSIKKDINKFADSLFPVIGPAIRKSISETLRQMLQSLNQVLEHAFSWQGVKWRLESFRTGVPFEQVVLLNSFTFRVDQVFLIHRKTGVLLNSVEQDDALSLHVDMVSSMLTAIGDFVGDSFQTAKRQTLDSIQVGDFSILIEQGPEIILAVACRGEVSNSLRSTMVKVVEDTQLQFAQELEIFNGDTMLFERSRAQLLLCLLQTRQRPTIQKMSLRTKAVWLLIFVILSYWVIGKISLNIQQQNYIGLLEQEAGFVITQTSYDGDLLVIKGLRDPLARDPYQLIGLTRLNRDQINLQFKPFQSYDDAFVKQRILKIIRPPKNTKIDYSNGLLRLSGFASQEKINAMKIMSPLIVGVTEVEVDGLSKKIDLSGLQKPNEIDLILDIDSGHLTIKGKAYESWLDSVESKALSIPGVQSVDKTAVEVQFDLSILKPPENIALQLMDKVLYIKGEASNKWIMSVGGDIDQYSEIDSIDLSQFVNIDEVALKKRVEWIQQQVILFDSALSFSNEAQKKLNILANTALESVQLSRLLSKDFLIVIQGFSDSVGLHESNVLLSLERAEFVAQYLFDGGVNPKYIQIKGLDMPVVKEINSEQRAYNRRVTFSVKINNEERKGNI